jgi:hypothetical protein
MLLPLIATSPHVRYLLRSGYLSIQHTRKTKRQFLIPRFIFIDGRGISFASYHNRSPPPTRGMENGQNPIYISSSTNHNTKEDEMKKTLAPMLTALVITLTLVGCSPDAPTATPTSTPSSSASATPSATPTEAPVAEPSQEEIDEFMNANGGLTVQLDATGNAVVDGVQIDCGEIEGTVATTAIITPDPSTGLPYTCASSSLGEELGLE